MDVTLPNENKRKLLLFNIIQFIQSLKQTNQLININIKKLLKKILPEMHLTQKLSSQSKNFNSKLLSKYINL